jgi:hypothetical protein
MFAPRFATIAVVAVGLAGCGGSDASYSVDATRACLEGTSADVDPDPEHVDFIALGAGRGAIRAEFDKRGLCKPRVCHEVILSFSRNASDAKDVKAAYDARGDPVFPAPTTDQKGNAVMAWSNAPADEERKTVEDCLS